MDSKKAIYVPPNRRHLFQAGNENSKTTIHCSTRTQSDHKIVSSGSHDHSPMTDFVELSPCLGNMTSVDNDSSSGPFQSASFGSNSKGKFCSSSAKNLNEDIHSSRRLSDHMVNTFGKSCKMDESFENTKSGIKQGQASQSKMESSGELDGSKNMVIDAPYSICSAKNEHVIKLKTPLLLNNRERRKEMDRAVEWKNIRILRPGMIHLRHYLSVADQVKIIETCCKLGIGPGGFYQPGYQDGRKLNLKMMCLGKNWDPQTSTYGNERSTDGANPPPIPDEFCKLVEHTIQECHLYMKRNADKMLPSLTPDICIVNFYTQSGRLGLHQDKDESRESLRRGLPVVSFSIGDSAEFVYGDQRDIDKAEKVILESGDVLIFGGSSRHIFHGVTSINRGTAPKILIEETNLRPGRLNLTFRQY